METNVYDAQVTQETPDFLTEVSLSVLKENLVYQFKEPAWVSVDYVAEFLTSFKYSIGMCEDDVETEEVERLKDDFLAFMTELFKSRLKVGFPNLLDTPTDDQVELLHFTYRFFILDIKMNYLNFIWNYITEHKASLAQEFKSKKDITALAFKKELKDEDVVLISSLSKIVDFILSQDLTVDDFLRYCEGSDSRLETVMVSHGYDNYDLTGNFISSYTKMIGEIERRSIESIIRSYVLKSYRTPGG